MSQKVCENGHYWDSDMYSSCPYCAGLTSPGPNRSPMYPPTSDYSGSDEGATVQIGGGYGPPWSGPTEPQSIYQNDINDEGGKTERVDDPHVSNVTGGETTFVREKTVGWLTAISGVYKGQSFPLHSQFNYIGRNPKNSVVLSADGKVSGKHIYVAYDNETNIFFAGAGEATNIAHYNGKALLPGSPINLSPYDELKVGDTRLLFVPLCSSQFKWEDTENSGSGKT